MSEATKAESCVCVGDALSSDDSSRDSASESGALILSLDVSAWVGGQLADQATRSGERARWWQDATLAQRIQRQSRESDRFLNYKYPIATL